MLKAVAIVVMGFAAFGFLMTLVNGDSPRKWLKR